MKEIRNQSADVDITAAKGVLGKLGVRALAIALVPAVLVTTWIVVLREPLVRQDASVEVSTVVATARAQLVSHYVSDLLRRTEVLATTIPNDATVGPADPFRYGFADAAAIHIIPLDEMGTIDLAPGVQGVSSHIGVDIVRRAFNGDNPQPEAVLSGAAPHLLVARPYGTPAAGVVLVELPHSRLSGLFKNDFPEGEYQLSQGFGRGGEQIIAGGVSTQSLGSATVSGTGWRVEFSPRGTWLDRLLQPWWVLVLGMLTVIIGVSAAITTTLLSIQRLLKRDAATIEAAAEGRSVVHLQLSDLVGVARQMRQLGARKRQKVADRLRAKGDTVPPESHFHAASATIGNAVEKAADNEEASEPLPSLEPSDESIDNEDDAIPAHIFMADCIRGDADAELTDELVEQIGFALAVLANRQNIEVLALGYDARPSSKRIRTTLIKALLASGIDVVELGSVATPLAHYATHNSAAKSCVMITGGHCSSGTNGLKFSFNQQPPTADDMQSLLSLVREGARIQGVGRTSKEDIVSHYIDKISRDISLALPLRLVIDCDFGSSARIAPALFEAIDCEVISYNHPGDGERDQDWQLITALNNLGAKVRDSGADLGVLFDSDGDRLHTVTETGRLVDTDQLFMLLAQDVLERNPGVDAVYDVTFSKHFSGFIARQGGRAVQAACSVAAVRERLLASNALLGSDFAGHMIFADRWYNFDDALYALARLLELLSAATSSYEGLVGTLPKTVATPELYASLSAVTASPLLSKLAESEIFSDARLTTVDGVRVDYTDGWGLIRYAESDNALVLRFEGDDVASLERVQAVFREALRGIAPALSLPF